MQRQREFIYTGIELKRKNQNVELRSLVPELTNLKYRQDATWTSARTNEFKRNQLGNRKHRPNMVYDMGSLPVIAEAGEDLDADVGDKKRRKKKGKKNKRKQQDRAEDQVGEEVKEG